MLRIEYITARRRKRLGSAAGALPGFASHDDASRPTIVRDFDHPLLELIRLLHEAAEIEHSLMVQYLYAALSANPIYPNLRGTPFSRSDSLLRIAIEEMEHLRAVLKCLATLGGSADMARQDLPVEMDIYPFPMNLEPLTRYSAAKYAYTEAPKREVDPATSNNPEFARQVIAELGSCRPNHIGSVYGTIIVLIDEVSGRFAVRDLSGHRQAMVQIRDEGEQDHFRFFRDLFLGTHPVFEHRTNVWTGGPGDPEYPSMRFPTNPTAYRGHKNQIPSESIRELAWLGNLQYWSLCMLLSLGYAGPSDGALFSPRDMIGRAVAHMVQVLWPLGELLADHHGVGLTFDRLSLGYRAGKNDRSSIRILRHLLGESIELIRRRQADLPFGDAIDLGTLASLPGGNEEDPDDGASLPPSPAPEDDAETKMLELISSKAIPGSIFHGAIDAEGKPLQARFADREFRHILDFLRNGKSVRPPTSGQPLIVPGKPEESALLVQITQGVMMGRFSEDEVAVVRRWIESLGNS